MRKLPSTKSCFVCGLHNPAGLKLAFQTDGQTVSTHFTPEQSHIGYKGTVHGGILSALLDEVMAWACIAASKQFAFCVELQVRFSLPAVPGKPIAAIGQITANRRNKLFETIGELRDEENRVLASATGKFMAIKPADMESMLDELEGGAEALRQL